MSVADQVFAAERDDFAGSKCRLAGGTDVFKEINRARLRSGKEVRITVAIDIGGLESRIGENDVCRSEEHTSELQSLTNLVCRLLLEKKKRTGVKHSDRHTVSIHARC